jgi:hypothetical protein
VGPHQKGWHWFNVKKKMAMCVYVMRWNLTIITKRWTIRFHE